MRIGRVGKGAGLAFIILAGCSQASPSSSSSTGSSGEHAATARQAIQGGTTDTDDTFAVGVCGGQAGNCSGFCSGALITPNLVVTARHCISQSPKMIDCSQNPTFGGLMFGSISITTNTQMSGGGSSGWHAVKSYSVPTDDHVCGHDIALLVLDDLVDPSEAKPITPNVRFAPDAHQYLNEFAAIGYGATSPAEQGVGTRRIRVGLSMVCFPGAKYIDCPAQAGVNENEFIGSSGTCEGDSGSSAFEWSTYKIGRPVSFGVLSRGGISDDGTKCEGSLYTRLDKWRDFIVDGANAASENWTLYNKPNPDWTLPPDPPDTDPPDGTKPPTDDDGPSAELGDACTSDDECTTGTCATFGDGMVCSTACDPDDATSCPEGYACTDADEQSLCLPETSGSTEPQATTTNTSDGGCAVTHDPTQPTPWRWGTGALALVGLAIVRRRRRT